MDAEQRAKWRTLRLNKNPDAGLLREHGNCEVYELEDISSQIRH